MARPKGRTTLSCILKNSVVDGEIDVKRYLNDPRVKKKLLTAITEGLDGKRTNSQLLKLFTQLTGDLLEKKEDNHKFELSTEDRIRIARETLNGLREDYSINGGSCPVCGGHQILRHEVCVPPEPEHAESGEMAPVALPS